MTKPRILAMLLFLAAILGTAGIRTSQSTDRHHGGHGS